MIKSKEHLTTEGRLKVINLINDKKKISAFIKFDKLLENPIYL